MNILNELTHHHCYFITLQPLIDIVLTTRMKRVKQEKERKRQEGLGGYEDEMKKPKFPQRQASTFDLHPNKPNNNNKQSNSPVDQETIHLLLSHLSTLRLFSSDTVNVTTEELNDLLYALYEQGENSSLIRKAQKLVELQLKRARGFQDTRPLKDWEKYDIHPKQQTTHNTNLSVPFPSLHAESSTSLSPYVHHVTASTDASTYEFIASLPSHDSPLSLLCAVLTLLDQCSRCFSQMDDLYQCVKSGVWAVPNEETTFKYTNQSASINQYKQPQRSNTNNEKLKKKVNIDSTQNFNDYFEEEKQPSQIDLETQQLQEIEESNRKQPHHLKWPQNESSW